MGIEFEDTIHIQPEVSGGGTPVDAYTKEETDTLLDNRIEPIEEVIPSNASSSNQLVTANDIDNFSNKELSNLSIDGNNRLHALKGYEDNGELLTDAEGLADIQSYARSTFDLSKFTVVGTPTITDDGIVSGLNGSNYVQTRFPSSVTNFTAKLNFKFNDTSITSYSNYCIHADMSPFMIYVNASNGKYGNINAIFTNSNVSEQYNFGSINASRHLTTERMYFEYRLLNNTLSCRMRFGETGDWINFPATHTITDAIQTKTFSRLQRASFNSDLKQFSINVDGVEIFSGNKTGIDTYTIGGDTVTIPYTLSKTGAKIVDSQYRDRVEDVYNQFGYAPYYTLSDTDFTLPMGELYGMIERKADVSDIPDVSGLATKTELTDGLSTKQDTLTAGDGIDIKMVNPDAVANVYYSSNGIASATTQLTEQQATSVTLVSSAQKYGTFAQGIDTTRSLDIEVVLPLTWTSGTTYRKCISNSDNNMGGSYSNGAIRVSNTYGSNAIQFQYGRANSNYNNLGTFTLTNSFAPQLYVKLSKTDEATPTFTIYAKENSTDDYTIVGTVTYNATTFPYGLATDRYILVVMDSGTDTFDLTLNSVVYTPARDPYLEISTVNKVSSTGVVAIVTTTSTEYGLLTPDSSTLYILTDTGAIYLGTTLIAEKNT